MSLFSSVSYFKTTQILIWMAGVSSQVAINASSRDIMMYFETFGTRDTWCLLIQLRKWKSITASLLLVSDPTCLFCQACRQNTYHKTQKSTFEMLLDFLGERRPAFIPFSKAFFYTDYLIMNGLRRVLSLICLCTSIDHSYNAESHWCATQDPSSSVLCWIS